jgi:hypothetical protein
MLTNELLREALEAAAKAAMKWPKVFACSEHYSVMHKGKRTF